MPEAGTKGELTLASGGWAFWLGYGVGGAICLTIVRTVVAIATFWWRGGRLRYLLVNGAAWAFTWWNIWTEHVSGLEKEMGLIGSWLCILAWTAWNLCPNDAGRPSRPT